MRIYLTMLMVSLFLFFSSTIVEATSCDLPFVLSSSNAVKNKLSNFEFKNGMLVDMFLNGKNRVGMKFDFASSMNFSQYEELVLDMSVDSLSGLIAEDPFLIRLFDTNGKLSRGFFLPKELLSGERMLVRVPLSKLYRGAFDHSSVSSLKFLLFGSGKISGKIHLYDAYLLKNTDLCVVEEEPIVEEPVVEEVVINFLEIAQDFGVVKSGGASFSLPENALIQMLLAGWGNANIRLRLDEDLDISSYDHLQIDFSVSNVNGDLLPDPLTLQFYDSSWNLRSFPLVLPVDVVGPQSIKIPFSELFDESFSQSALRDITFQFVSPGPLSVNLDVSRLLFYSTDFLSVVEVPPAVEAPVVEEPVSEEPLSYNSENVSLITNEIVELVLDGNLDENSLRDPSNWVVSSGTDNAFLSGVTPSKVAYFKATLDVLDTYESSGYVPVPVMRNHIYLFLPQSLDYGKTYQVRLNANVGKIFHYDGVNGYFDEASEVLGWNLSSLPSKAIKINQFGYNEASKERFAYIGYWLANEGALALPESIPYDVFSADSGELVYSGSSVSRGFDTASGENVHELDISSLGEGKFYIQAQGIGRSAVFRIGNNASFEAYYTTLRGLFHQRAGVALSSENTSWSHDICQSTVYKVDVLEDWGKFFPSNTDKSQPITLQGGWFDAGDFDRRPLHLTVVEHLLILAEMFPDRVIDGSLDLPESGNGMSDVLDEALFGLKLWEQLQNSDGGVRAGIESSGHPGKSDCNDGLDYWTYSANRWTSYRFAAAASHTSRLLRENGLSQRADELLSKAVSAWNWAEAQTSVGTTSPVNGGSSQASLDRERLWAAGELFASTSEANYSDVFASLWPNLRGPTHFDTIYSLWGMANSSADSELRADVRQRILNSAQEFINFTNGNEYRNSLNPNYSGSFSWGSATNSVKTTVPMIMAYHFDDNVVNRQKYIDTVSLNADYQLGAHPSGRSWITGMGYEVPEFPLHLNSMYDGIEQVVPGLPINGAFSDGGSCLSNPGSTYWKCLVFNNFSPSLTSIPPIHRYAPWARMAPMNEFTVWTDMSYTSLAYGFLYAVSEDNPVSMKNLSPDSYPLNALR